MKNRKKPGYSPCQKAEMKYVANRERPDRKYVYLSSQPCVRLFHTLLRVCERRGSVSKEEIVSARKR